MEEEELLLVNEEQLAEERRLHEEREAQEKASAVVRVAVTLSSSTAARPGYRAGRLRGLFCGGCRWARLRGSRERRGRRRKRSRRRLQREHLSEGCARTRLCWGLSTSSPGAVCVRLASCCGSHESWLQLRRRRTGERKRRTEVFRHTLTHPREGRPTAPDTRLSRSPHMHAARHGGGAG